MVHKMQFSEDCVFNNMQRRGCKPRQQKENQGHTKGKAEKIFIACRAENGARHSALCRCKTYYHQRQTRLLYVVALE